jgi:chromosome segregation ATPase
LERRHRLGREASIRPKWEPSIWLELDGIWIAGYLWDWRRSVTMPVRLRNYSKILVSLGLILAFCVIESDAQTRRKKRTRRARRPAVARPVITNPTIVAPAATATAATAQEKTATTGDVKIISTADSTTETAEPTTEKKSKNATTQASPEDMQQTITDLSKQVNRLADKLGEMQDDDRYQLEMERLTRAEQRAEQLRMQLVDVQSKIADLESKLEEIEYAIKPENIERTMQTYGSTRPEEARETRRRQLESERTRLKAQLKILSTSQARLEVSCANADSEVDLLRAKLQQRREQMEAAPKKPEKQ